MVDAESALASGHVLKTRLCSVRLRTPPVTRQGWTVNAARLAVAAPWAVLLLLGTQSATLQTFDSRGGVLLLVIGGAVCLAAYRIMLRIGRLPEEPRVLR